MAEKTKIVRITETKENVFNALKQMFPNLFGDYVFADLNDGVNGFRELETDPSKLLIEFAEEAE